MLKSILLSPYTLALALGGLCGLALPPLNLLPLTFLALSSFFYIYLKIQPKNIGLYNYFFAFGYFTTGLYWIGNALLVEGNDYSWAWPLAVLGLPAGLSIFYGLAGFITKRFLSKESSLVGALLLAHSIMLAELARSFLFTGFPWNLLGTTWSNYLPLIQIASEIGLLGLTWLVLLLSALLGFGVYTKNIKHRVSTIALVVIVITLNTGYGVYSLGDDASDTEQSLHVIAIQPSIPQHEKWDPLLRQSNLDKLINTSLKALNSINDPQKPILIIWPETTLSYHQTEGQDFFKQLMSTLKSGRPNEFSLMTGALVRTVNTKQQRYNYRNAALHINDDGLIINSYTKSHLVPFGEYIPLKKYIPLKTVTGFTGFETGDGATVTKTSQGLNYVFKICYEIIFPSEIINKESMTQHDNKDMNAIVHMTNDAWYGLSPGPYQHNNIAQFRALENNSHVFRAANRGISSIISPQGRILSKTPLENSSYAYSLVLLNNSNGSLYILVGIRLMLVFFLTSLIILTVANIRKNLIN